MNSSDLANAKNILLAINTFVNYAEGNVIEIFGGDQNNPDGNYRCCINVARNYGRGKTYFANSLTDCLKKAGIRVKPLEE